MSDDENVLSLLSLFVGEDKVEFGIIVEEFVDEELVKLIEEDEGIMLELFFDELVTLFEHPIEKNIIKENNNLFNFIYVTPTFLGNNINMLKR